MAGLTRCKNPACEYHDQCRFARVPSANQAEVINGNQAPAPPPTDDCPKLTIEPNGLGRIYLNQGVGPTLAPLISELEGLDPDHIPGVLIRIMSGGGDGSWGDKLILAIKAYLKKGGVAVSLIEIAYSCAFETAMVCTKAFALPDSLGGHIGV